MPPKAKATKKDKIEVEEEEEPTPRRSTRSSSSTAKTTSTTTAAKNSKAASKSPAKGKAASKSPAKGKASPKSPAKGKAKAPAAKGKAKSPAKGKAKAPAKGKGKKEEPEEEDEDEEEEGENEEEEEEEEEEKEEEKPKRGRAAAKGKKPEPKTKLQTKTDAKTKAKDQANEKVNAAEEQVEQEEEDEKEEEKDAKEEPKTKGKRGRAKTQEKKLDEAADDGKDKKPAKLDMANIEVKIDDYCPQRYNLKVYIKDEEIIFDSKLNQSNVNANNNKFYIIQLLQHKTDDTKFYVFFRWGRVGVPGDTKFQGPMGEDKAIKEYNKKLHEKSVKGDYRVLEMDYTKEVPEAEKEAQMEESSKTTTLKKPVADFIKLIFDTKMATKQMQQIGYDAQKLPLGKLSKNNIEKGYGILNDLLEVIQKKKTGNLSQLSNDFYSYIPHNVGYAHMSNFTIKDEETVKKKLELLDSLRNIKTTYELLEQKGDVDNMIDANYQKLKCKIEPITQGTDTYKMIEQFIDNTKESAQVSILNMYEINREGEYDRYTKDIDNKLLLWHGSRLANFVGILSQGLRIAPPEAPASGYRFGKGIYLADMFSKSHGYCASYGSDGVFCIMLCEGACGNFNELLHDDFNASKLAKDKHSTKALGHVAPPESSYHEIEKGIKIPLGKPEKTQYQNSSCYNNEFIIYDVSQVRIRYLIWMKEEGRRGLFF